MGNFDDNKDKARPDFSNVISGGSSTAPPAPGQPAPAPPAEKIYVVAAGDSLSKIAKREYGDANKWPKIYDANRDSIKDPNLIHPGQKLKIPNA